MLKRLTAILLTCAFAFTLSGCFGTPRTHSIRYKNEDGTVTRIEWKNAPILSRLPSFEQSGSSLTMRFNGDYWYSVRIITAEEFKDIDSSGAIACSANMKVYITDEECDALEENPYAYPEHYIYVLDLEGTDDSYIRFDYRFPPDEMSYDFQTNIAYWVDKTSTIPDEEFLIL